MFFRLSGTGRNAGVYYLGGVEPFQVLGLMGRTSR
jgi:hypothetical protein